MRHDAQPISANSRPTITAGRRDEGLDDGGSGVRIGMFCRFRVVRRQAPVTVGGRPKLVCTRPVGGLTISAACRCKCSSGDRRGVEDHLRQRAVLASFCSTSSVDARAGVFTTGRHASKTGFRPIAGEPRLNRTACQFVGATLQRIDLAGRDQVLWRSGRPRRSAPVALPCAPAPAHRHLEVAVELVVLAATWPRSVMRRSVTSASSAESVARAISTPSKP